MESGSEFEVDKVIPKDTTGAGDAFNGALVYRLSLGDNIENAIKYANKVASQTVLYDYVLPGILSLKETEK